MRSQGGLYYAERRGVRRRRWTSWCASRGCAAALGENGRRYVRAELPLGRGAGALPRADRGRSRLAALAGAGPVGHGPLGHRQRRDDPVRVADVEQHPLRDLARHPLRLQVDHEQGLPALDLARRPPARPSCRPGSCGCDRRSPRAGGRASLAPGTSSTLRMVPTRMSSLSTSALETVGFTAAGRKSGIGCPHADTPET